MQIHTYCDNAFCTQTEMKLQLHENILLLHTFQSVLLCVSSVLKQGLRILILPLHGSVKLSKYTKTISV